MSFTAFLCFQLLYMTLAVDKMDGHGLINSTHYKHLPKKTKVKWYYIATKGLPKRWSTLVIKVSGLMQSNTFKRRLTFSFTVIILA